MPDREIEKSKPVYGRRLLFTSIFFAALVIADLGVIGYLSYRVLRQEIWKNAVTESELMAESISRKLQEIAHHEDENFRFFTKKEQLIQVQEYVDKILTSARVEHWVEIRDDQGNLVSRKVRRSPSRKAPIEGRNLTEKGKAETIIVDLGFRESRVPAALVTEPGIHLGTVEVAVLEDALEEQFGELRRSFLYKIFLGSLISLLLLGLTFLYVLKLIRQSRRLEAEAQMADRLAYVGSLASGLAHEIRNPLNAMNVNLQMLEEELNDPPVSPAEEIRPLIEGTLGEIRRLNRLVTDFLDYARPSKPKMVPVDVNGVVKDTVEFLRAELEGTGIRITAALSPKIPLVDMDPQRIRQALMNILLNAKQVLGKEGRIEVSAAVGSQGEVRISVRDNGPGIPVSDREKIFHIFYSTKGGGTGMGLPIARRILESHGGSLEVESTPGNGTCFILIFPRDRRSGESRKVDSPEADLVHAAVIAKN